MNDKELPSTHPATAITPVSPDQLMREIIRLNKMLSRIEYKLNQMGHDKTPSDDLDVLQRDIREIKSHVFKEAIQGERSRRQIEMEIAELRTCLAQLQQNTHFSPGVRQLLPEADQRVGIFVDVQNIFYAAKQFNARLDFDKLLKVAVGPRRLVRAIAYVVQSPEVDQSGFISMLQQKGYEIQRKDLRQRSDGSAKGDWDIGMTIDILQAVGTLDVVVIVTGDGDFVPLVNCVKNLGPRAEIVSFPHNTARDLIYSADRHVPIEESMLMRPGNGKNGEGEEQI